MAHEPWIIYCLAHLQRKFVLEVQRQKDCRGCSVREGFKEEVAFELSL